MAESKARLRLGVQHSRTPTTPRSVNSNESDATGDLPATDCRRPSLSRKSRASPESPFDSLPLPDEYNHLFIRNHDQVRYNPSLDQMVETIQVYFMTRGLLEPLPIEYNSYVLHLVEGFAKAKKSMREAETDYDELKKSLDKNLELWLERESQFRAEVKRLEVLLSKASRDGLEAVTLARANSVVDRSVRKGATFLSIPSKGGRHNVDDLEESSIILPSGQSPGTEARAIQTGNGGKVSEERGLKQVPIPKILDNENDFLISEKLRQLDAVTETLASNHATRAEGLGHANERSTAGPSSQLREIRLRFSFDPGDDLNPLLVEAEQWQGYLDSQHHEQSPSHLTHDSLQCPTTKRRQCHASRGSILLVTSQSDREQKASTGNTSPVLRSSTSDTCAVAGDLPNKLATARHRGHDPGC